MLLLTHSPPDSRLDCLRLPAPQPPKGNLFHVSVYPDNRLLFHTLINFPPVLPLGRKDDSEASTAQTTLDISLEYKERC